MTDKHNTLTIEEAGAFADRAPWREVQWQRPGSQMDPHWYLIVGDTIDSTTFWAFVRLIRAKGHRGTYVARYRPETPFTNHYLEIGDQVYWAIPPRQLCRTLIEFVLLPSTLVVGWRALPFYDPPETKDGKPIKVASPPCVVFELRDRDGKQHAFRTWTALDGCGKADLGGRSPKKTAATAEGDNIAGRSALLGRSIKGDDDLSLRRRRDGAGGGAGGARGNRGWRSLRRGGDVDLGRDGVQALARDEDGRGDGRPRSQRGG